MGSKVFPTKNNLMATKKSLALAKLGYDLMDRKRNILIHEIMAMTDKASTIQQDINTSYAKAYYALEQAQISIGNCSAFAECVPIENGLKMTVRSVMGVELPQISLEKKSRASFTDSIPQTPCLTRPTSALNRQSILRFSLPKLKATLFALRTQSKKLRSAQTH